MGKSMSRAVQMKPTVRALHGTTRALIQNMVTGVSEGFTKVLEIDGVGYRAEMDGLEPEINCWLFASRYRRTSGRYFFDVEYAPVR
jgi:ribosomal protein L6P/L9E